MSYNLSNLDKSLASWFEHDMSHALLRSISLEAGTIRGLKPFTINFDFPIAAIAGRNGCGKSTMLALAACAFHNDDEISSFTNRSISYYRFSDFFFQSGGEVPPEGISILYGIAYNEWKVTEDDKIKEEIGHQRRMKPKGGKWNDYEQRVCRQVVFFGIDRVVPHSEKSISRSYRRRFTPVDREGWEDKVGECVGYILGDPYEDFEYRKHSRYRLPFVKKNGGGYSGFNMGAGENALFEIFSVIYAAPNGALIIIDEIELGLHEQAQKRLIEKLKQTCLDKKIQVICTTHSSTILKVLPPPARFYLEKYTTRTNVIPGISPAYATGKLAGENSRELDIYVEDEVAKCILVAIFDHTLRSRIQIIPIGSCVAVVHQLASRKLHQTGIALACLDADQKIEHNKHKKTFIGRTEPATSEQKTDFNKWFDKHLLYMPGDAWPEKWLVQQSMNAAVLPKLSKTLGVDESTLIDALREADCAAKHKEIRTLADYVHLQEQVVLQKVVDAVVETFTSQFAGLLANIKELLSNP